MFAFRYIGNFDLDKPLFRDREYGQTAPNVTKPIPRNTVLALQNRFPTPNSALKWSCGSLMSFLSQPGAFHPFERALVEEFDCAVLNMRMEVICAPGRASLLSAEVWQEADDLKCPATSEFPWHGEFYRRLVWSEDESDRLPPSLQGQLLYAATNLEYELRSSAQRWNDAKDVFLAYEKFVLTHLCDGTFGAAACSVSRRAMEGLNAAMNVLMNGDECDASQAGDDLEHVVKLAYHWCRLHPLPLPPAKVMWEESAV